ncbi:MAG TPA: hypothetical protein ENK31_08010, partial [Nannocystis exedens]|nr:hypothetical protein [Nannocystis exedens]
MKTEIAHIVVVRRFARFACLALITGACGDDGASSGSASSGITATVTESGSTSTDGSASGTTETTSGTEATDTTSMTVASMSSTGATESDTSTASGGESSTTAGVGCGACDQPNQTCIDDVCVDLCQGMNPDSCGPDKVCDIISGECKDPDAACTVAGESQVCGEMSCGPGTICDGEGECLAIAPCAGVVCTEDGDCWGDACSCSRGKECDDPSEELLNGPFS